MKIKILQNILPRLFGIALHSWPATAAGFELQESTDFHASQWTNVTAIPTVVGDEKHFVLTNSAGNRSYRLFKP